jgi:hypothetical protein
MPTHYYVKTLAVISSQLNPKIIDAYEMLVHPRATFYPCMSELFGGIVVIPTVLISYDDVEVAIRRK